jgi:hypothetical protein
MNDLLQMLNDQGATPEVRRGHTAGYRRLGRYEAADDRDDLAEVRFGRLLRVPRARLEDWAGGPLDARSNVSVTPPDRTASRTESVQEPPRRRNVQVKRCARQPQLPFDS